MVDMRVRYVRRHVPSGSDVAVLGPATGVERPMIALSVSRPDALELGTELAHERTPRTGVYDLTISILGAAGASVTSIEVLEAPGQAAQARLHLSSPRGQSEIQVEVGQALSLSVRIGKLLHVSDRLVEAVTQVCTITPPAVSPPARDPSSDRLPLANEPSERPSPDVPEQFRRAFDD